MVYGGLLCCGIVILLQGPGTYAWLAPRGAASAGVRPVIQPPRPTGTPAEHFTGEVHYDILAKLLANDRRSTPPEKWLRELVDEHAIFHVDTESHPLVGQAVPDFTLEDQRGQPWNLQKQVARGPVVVVFYLGYFCNACVHDLFEWNADLDRLRTLGAEIVAISGDTSQHTREQFERFGPFGFTVLSDPEHATAQTFGLFQAASDAEPEKLLHGTFLIARDRQVRWVNTGATPFRNNKSLLYDVARLENKLPQPESAITAE